MVFMLLGMLIPIIILVKIIRDANDWVEGLFMIIATGFFVVIGFVLGGLLAMFIGYAFEQRPVEAERLPLYAINDSVGTEGRFFLGSGSVNGIMNYYFYVEKDGGYIAEKESMKNAIIFEENNHPHIVKYASEFVNRWNYLVAIPGKEYRTRFYIPEGSILQNYQLDLK